VLLDEMQRESVGDLVAISLTRLGDGDEGRAAEAGDAEKTVGEGLPCLADQPGLVEPRECKHARDGPFASSGRALIYAVVTRIEADRAQQLHVRLPLARGDTLFGRRRLYVASRERAPVARITKLTRGRAPPRRHDLERCLRRSAPCEP